MTDTPQIFRILPEVILTITGVFCLADFAGVQVPKVK